VSDRITEHFRWAEVAYHAGCVTYEPDSCARRMIQLTCQLILEPLREHVGGPVYIIGGGGYDPLTNDAGEWVSHRTSCTTQHHHGGALDFRVGVSSNEPWDLDDAHEWIERRLDELGIPGGVGIYPGSSNRFIHVDLRTPAARWEG